MLLVFIIEWWILERENRLEIYVRLRLGVAKITIGLSWAWIL